jgi:hypothetical protein
MLRAGKASTSALRHVWLHTLSTCNTGALLILQQIQLQVVHCHNGVSVSSTHLVVRARYTLKLAWHPGSAPVCKIA